MKLKVKYPEPVSEEKEQEVFLYLEEDGDLIDLKAEFGSHVYTVLSIKPDGIVRYIAPGDFETDYQDFIKILR